MTFTTIIAVIFTTVGISICIWKNTHSNYLSESVFPIESGFKILMRNSMFWYFHRICQDISSKTIWIYCTSLDICLTKLWLTVNLNTIDIDIISSCKCSKYLQEDWTKVPHTDNIEHVLKLPSEGEIWIRTEILKNSCNLWNSTLVVVED